jgi:hypothetical protein
MTLVVIIWHKLGSQCGSTGDMLPTEKENGFGVYFLRYFAPLWNVSRERMERIKEEC